MVVVVSQSRNVYQAVNVQLSETDKEAETGDVRDDAF
ncbi:Uncharacterised protein [Vibrio cholerae]|nr:Uncharacterised protein [Vibrio cholerae]